MTELDPLSEWSRLENENSMHSIVSAMYLGMLTKSPQIEAFATWLLAGAGATASLLVVNAKSITEVLSNTGFQVSLYCLVTSAFMGLCAKAVTVFFPSSGEDQKKLRESVSAIFSAHQEERKKIEASAQTIGKPVPPDLDISAILEEFQKPLPFWSKWLLKKYKNPSNNHRQSDLHIGVKAFNWQCNLCFLQFASYIAFLLCVAHYAKVI